MKYALPIMIVFICCRQQERAVLEVIKVDIEKVDSIRKHSDTGYTRTIGAAEFNSAEQYFCKKDSIVSKIMKDTAGRIVAFIQFRNNIRIAYAEYYGNGQLKGKLPLNAEGQFDGLARYYYEDGRIKSEGIFKNGLFLGQWKNYDENGWLVAIDEYDENGQMIKSVKKD